MGLHGTMFASHTNGSKRKEAPSYPAGLKDADHRISKAKILLSKECSDSVDLPLCKCDCSILFWGYYNPSFRLSSSVLIPSLELCRWVLDLWDYFLKASVHSPRDQPVSLWQPKTLRLFWLPADCAEDTDLSIEANMFPKVQFFDATFQFHYSLVSSCQVFANSYRWAWQSASNHNQASGRGMLIFSSKQWLPGSNWDLRFIGNSQHICHSSRLTVNQLGCSTRPF